MKQAPSNIVKDVDKTIKLLNEEDILFCIKTLDNYPAQPHKDDSTGKGRKFLDEFYGGESKGLYLAYNKSDVYNDETKKFLTKQEFLDQFKSLAPKILYDGEGTTLERIAKMRAKVGTQKPNPVAFYCQDKGLSHSDIAVISFPLGLSTKERKDLYETPIQEYTSAIREDGKRFELDEYSSSNGEKGTKAYSLELEIMSIADLNPEAAMKRYAVVQDLLNRSMGKYLAANSIHYLSSSKAA